ncbi:MarR family transcriptional regulator [Streptomyces sp. NPDC047022]|uniref:MarR family transcriptional regulator n=1 Tax=Streptomyces sp. NPDC047022 TaxID=3155737 RepID=UPI0033EBCE31
MTDTPVIDGRLVGLAHYASRALLEQVLTSTGVTFTESAMLRALEDHGGHLDSTVLVTRVTKALGNADGQAAHAAAERLIADGLLDSATDGVSMTDAGRAVLEEVQAGGRKVAARLYADIPRADLETAGRVLTLVLQRANAELESS